MISDIILILFVGLISGIIARRLGQPLFLGYIFAGVIVGPHTGGVTVSDIPQIESMADIGVALLLFSLGLEFSLKDLIPIKGVAIWGSIIQVALTFFWGWGIGRIAGWTSPAALWFGAAVVSSSTAVILKTLTDRGHLRALSGRVMLSMSIVQDLTVIPIMILLDNMTKSGMSIGAALTPLAYIAGFLLLMKLVGTYLTPRWLHFVARWNSRELFMLSIIGLGLGLGYITHIAGLSLAFGAFITGLVLNESDYGHKALSEMIPIRDLFGLVFFVSVGMLLDPALLWKNLGTIALLTGAVCLGRGAVLSVISYSFGYRRIIPAALFFGMLPISEIAFVVIRSGLAAGALTHDIYSLILNTVIVSMLLGPFAAGLASPLYRRLQSKWPDGTITSINLPEDPLRDHVIIAGGGRLGRHAASVMTESKTPFVIIEPLYQSFTEFKSLGLPVIYGDPSLESVLEVAGLSRARIVLCTEGDLEEMRRIISMRAAGNLSFLAVARAGVPEDRPVLHEAGFNAVVLPDLEGGLQMARQSLAAMNLPDAEITACLERVRKASLSLPGTEIS